MGIWLWRLVRKACVLESDDVAESWLTPLLLLVSSTSYLTCLSLSPQLWNGDNTVYPTAFSERSN